MTFDEALAYFQQWQREQDQHQLESIALSTMLNG